MSQVPNFAKVDFADTVMPAGTDSSAVSGGIPAATPIISPRPGTSGGSPGC